MQSVSNLVSCASRVDEVVVLLKTPHTSSRRASMICSPLMGTRSATHTRGSLSFRLLPAPAGVTSQAIQYVGIESAHSEGLG